MENNLIIAFDTETTGLPDWKIPSDDPSQPHIVQLAAGLFDVETKKMIQSIDVIVKPDGWEIPQEVSEIHGITTEYANKVGVPEEVALDIFLALWSERKRIAHNTTFDNRIIRIATKRYKSEDVQVLWKAAEYECTMMESRKILGGKYPKLEEAYSHFLGKELVDAHTAFADMRACAEIYWALNGGKVAETEKAS